MHKGDVQNFCIVKHPPFKKVFEENIFFQGLLPCQDVDLMTLSLEALSYVWSENTTGVTELLGFLPHLLAYNKVEITGIIVISMRDLLILYK